MKQSVRIVFFILIVCFSGCNESRPKEYLSDCNSFAKEVVYSIAQTVLSRDTAYQIWNLSEIDTAYFFVTEDYFTSSETKNHLALIGGHAGLSSGTADHLLILFSCADTLEIIWAGQTGYITQSDIMDLNGDGIKEIVCNTSLMWQGECVDSYTVLNFSGGEKNIFYTARSSSVIDCGYTNLGDLYHPGDTLECRFDCSLIELDCRAYGVRQVRTVKIHDGGQTDEEILKNVKTVSDTVVVNFLSV